MPRAIDLHIHPPDDRRPPRGEPTAVERYFRSEPPPRDSAEMADYYAQLDVVGCLLTYDASSARGDPGLGNDYVASLVKRYPKQFPVGFGSVDPWTGKSAVAEIRRCAEELGLRGIKYHPSAQEFFPDDPRVFTQYEEAARHGLVLMFHTGMTGLGALEPGGGRIKFKYCRPIPHIDDVAAEFPELTVIMAHPAFPWVQEQLAILVHKPNVYMDLSGYSPKYFDPMLVQYANSRASGKMMFGSDYPWIRPKRWLDDFAAAPFKDEVRPKILLENARAVLGLDV